MKNFKKMLCAVLALVMLSAVVIPALAEIRLVPESETFYFNCETESSTNPYNWRSIYIEGLKGSPRIKFPRSSKSSVVGISSFRLSTEDQEWYYGEWSGGEQRGNIIVEMYNPGTATVSVKIDGKTYKTKVNVAGYVNPIKSFFITGISKKNLKSLFNTTAYVSLDMPSKPKSGYIKLEAAEGWVLKSLSIHGTGIGYYNIEMFRSSVQLRIPAPKKDYGGYYDVSIMIESENLKTGGRLYTMLWAK